MSTAEFEPAIPLSEGVKTQAFERTTADMYCFVSIMCCSMYCLFVLLYVFFVCKCVLYYCHRVATKLHLNISYHIISYIIYIISYHIIYIISYHIISTYITRLSDKNSFPKNTITVFVSDSTTYRRYIS